MKIKDVMSTPAVSVPAFTLVRDVARHMDYSGVGCVVVIDNGRVAGVVTDRDLVLRVLARRAGGETVVARVMTEDPVTVRPGDDLDAAFEALRRHAFRRLPVVDGDGDVVGMVTVDDLLLHVNQLTGDMIRPVVSEIAAPQHS